MNEPIDELVTYADHTQGCMVGAGHYRCTCGYDDAHAKMWAAWEALKADNDRLRKALLRIADKNAWDEVMELKNMAHAALEAKS